MPVNLQWGKFRITGFVNDEAQVHVSFFMPKARVVPLKLVSIPRLKLTAAVVSVNVVKELERELDFDIDTDIYYSDSTVVLGYIQNEARCFHVYVGH